MALRQVIYRVEVPVGGSGDSGINDRLSMYARVKLTDTIDTTATDDISIKLKASYAETNDGQGDTLSMYAKVNTADTAPAQSDKLTSLALTGAETNAEPLDVISKLALALPGENNTVPGEAMTTGFAGPALNDAATPALDARPSITVHTWAASQTSTGAGATNGANAVGAANGTIATVTGSGLFATDSKIVLTIPVASIPATGAKTLRCYVGYTATLVAITATFANPGGTPASGTIPVTNGSTIAASTDVLLTSIGTSLTVTFGVNSGALLAPTLTIDAVEVQTVSAL